MDNDICADDASFGTAGTTQTNGTNDTDLTNDTEVSRKKKKKVTDPLTLTEQDVINSFNKNITITDNGLLDLPDNFFETYFNGEQPNYMMHWCKHTISYYGYFKHVLFKSGPINEMHVAKWNNHSVWSDEDHTQWQIFASKHFIDGFKLDAQRAFQMEVLKRASMLGVHRENDRQNPSDVKSMLSILASPSYKDHFENGNMLKLFQWTHYLFRDPFCTKSNEWAYIVVRIFCNQWNIDTTFLIDKPNSGTGSTSRRHDLIRMVSKANELFGQQCRRWEQREYGFSYRKKRPNKKEGEAFFQISNPKGVIVIHKGSDAHSLVCNMIQNAVNAAQTIIAAPKNDPPNTQVTMTESEFIKLVKASFKGNYQCHNYC